MADGSEEANDIEKLYEFGERLNEAKDKSQNAKDYEGIINAARGSIKAKQLAAQLIPRFFKFFPTLHNQALDAHFDLCEEEELGVHLEAYGGLGRVLIGLGFSFGRLFLVQFVDPMEGAKLEDI